MQHLNTFNNSVVKKTLDLNRRELEIELERLELQERLELEELLDLEMERLGPGLRKRLELEMQQLGLKKRLGLEERLGEKERLEMEAKRLKLERLEMEKLAGIRQKSQIKGWLSKTLLEEWRGELEALRYRWLKEGKPELWVKIMTGFCLLELLKAYLQIKVENR